MTQTGRNTRGRSTGAATGQPPAGGATPELGDVEKAVRKDIEAFRRRDRDVADSGLAASALALARMIDDDENSATSRSMCARALREALDRLRELCPPADENDDLDELHGRAAAKLAVARPPAA